ncbi:hypothetical protein LDENG_00019780, partial [Lucifuga dentata]
SITDSGTNFLEQLIKLLEITLNSRFFSSTVKKGDKKRREAATRCGEGRELPGARESVREKKRKSLKQWAAWSFKEKSPSRVVKNTPMLCSHRSFSR